MKAEMLAHSDFKHGLDFILSRRDAILNLTAGPTEYFVVERTFEALAAQPAEQPAVPEGFVVVPVEPTEAMLARFWNVATGQHPMDERHFGLTKRQLQRAKTAYWAMLTAAKEARDGR